MLATPSTGVSTLIGRGTYDEFKIKRGMPGLELDLKARTDIDIATQTITFQQGTDSGWHKHPGPVFVSVIAGTMTFYDSGDPGCSPVVVTAGHGFVESRAAHAHRTKRKRLAGYQRPNLLRAGGRCPPQRRTPARQLPQILTTC